MPTSLVVSSGPLARKFPRARCRCGACRGPNLHHDQRPTRDARCHAPAVECLVQNSTIAQRDKSGFRAAERCFSRSFGKLVAGVFAITAASRITKVFPSSGPPASAHPPLPAAYNARHVLRAPRLPQKRRANRGRPQRRRPALPETDPATRPCR